MEWVVRKRCYQCFRPLPLCFCEAIPQIDNRTEVLILQHLGERAHAFNTARIVKKALRRCRLITDHNRRFDSNHLPIQASAGLLYPSADALALNELCPAERPEQLVVIDGTWSQAKTIVRDVLQLRDLPCYRLAPTQPGRYRIRREPDEQSLSTLEAVVAALGTLEPDINDLHLLQSAFDQMVEDQLSQTASRVNPRQKSQRAGLRFVPAALLQDSHNLIVGYGEATPGQLLERASVPVPVNWVAERLGTGERFSCCLRQKSRLTDAAFEHMRLSAADIAVATSQDEFCERWREFLCPNDVLVVHHQRTAQLLQNCGAVLPRSFVLKSIYRNWHASVQSQEELLAAEGLKPSTADGKSRATQRLDMSVALVEQLRSHAPRQSDPPIRITAATGARQASGH